MKRPVNKEQFGKRVAARRAEKNLTQEDLAAAIGMKQQGIDAIEKGRVERPRLMRELAVALDASEEWLLYHEGVSPPIATITGDADVSIARSSGGEAEQLFLRLPADARRLALEFLEFLAQRSGDNRALHTGKRSPNAPTKSET